MGYICLWGGGEGEVGERARGEGGGGEGVRGGWGEEEGRRKESFTPYELSKSVPFQLSGRLFHHRKEGLCVLRF